MRSFTYLIFTTLVFFISVSCRRDLNEVNNNNDAVETMQDMKVPIDFDWETNIEVDVIVNLHSTKEYQPKYKVSVMKNGPDSGSGLLASGSITPGKAFTNKLSLPAYTQNLTLVCESPFGSVLSQTVPLEAGIVAHTFSFENTEPRKSTPHFKNTEDGPDCNQGCDEYISGGGTVNISGGLTYCISDDFDGKINFQNWDGGGTLRICGTAKITNNQYLEDNSHIVVAEGGYLDLNKNVDLEDASITVYAGAEVIFGKIDFGNNVEFTVYENSTVQVKKFQGWGNNSPLENYGDITVLQDSYHNGSIINFGTLTYNGKFELNESTLYNGGTMNVDKKFYCYGSGSSIQNDGDLFVEKDIEYGSNAIFTNNGIIQANDAFKVYDNANLLNNGTIIVADNCDFSTNGDFTNNCYFETEKDLDFSGGVKIILNTGYLKAGEEINFWNNKTVELHSNCMVYAEDCELECDVEATGALSSFIVEEELSIWNNGDKFSGSVEVATEDGELDAGGDQNFIDGAYYTSIEDAVNYLPITACNPVGFGTPTIVDMDFDGVIDDLDEFPNDPHRAFISYFPNDIEYASVAFEDLWPSKGDYDFNDLVVAVYGSKVTNADDLLVDINFNFIVLAVGASLDNGFAFQLETITPDMVQSATGMVLGSGYVSLASNGLEADQNKAVVIVTESVNDVIHRPGGSFFNTVIDNPKGTSDTVSITITLSEPINNQLFGLDVFNPFIIKNQERNIEIHLAGFPPTDLMDTDLFGTGDDASNPVAGIYYTTTTNLPWGLFLLEPFDYPKEESQIIQAYNHFHTWAQTGGNTYNDWNLNYSGYRNSDDIY